MKSSSEDKYPNYTSPSNKWRDLKPLARQMRHNPTPSEDILWQRLRGRGVAGLKFRRQHAINGFIVDFVSIERQLIIEVDGDVHNYTDQHLYDVERQSILEAEGFRVLRFSDAQVLQDTDAVIEAIIAAVRK